MNVRIYGLRPHVKTCPRCGERCPEGAIAYRVEKARRACKHCAAGICCATAAEVFAAAVRAGVTSDPGDGAP